MAHLLSEEEIKKEIADIEATDKWPNHPLLPVKNLFEADPQDGLCKVGTIFAPDSFDSFKTDPVNSKQLLYRVYHINMFNLGDNHICIHDIAYTQFRSVEQMVRAGWVGD